MSQQRLAYIQDFYETMITMHRLIGPAHDSFLKEYGLTGPQVELFYVLYKTASCTVKDIASALCTTSGAATQLVEGMVKRGFVERTASTKDRRHVYVCLTPAGERFFGQFQKDHLVYIASFLEPLSTEDIQYSTKLRKRIIEHVIALRHE